MLRREYGITLEEYFFELPAWKRDLYLEGLVDGDGEVEEGESDVPAADPFDDVPEHLRDL